MIGEMFAGIGGLGWAVSRAFGLQTAWQADLVGEAVRARHWPNALQVVGDIRAVDPRTLPPITVLCGGFPCVDLSCAGPQPENPLDTGDRSGLYGEIIRFARVLSPRYVVMENVPGILKHQRRIEKDWRELGFGLTWIRCGAWDAGAPHIRRRVFIFAGRGSIGRGVVDASDAGRWTGDTERTWPTPQEADGLRGSANLFRGEGNPTLPGSVRVWPTIRAEEDRQGDCPSERERNNPSLSSEVQTWATPGASDAKDVRQHKGGNESLNHQARTDGRRLSPDWVETLMGFPVGWTNPTGPKMEINPSPRWPRGRYPADWDRTKLWPGYGWEPSRTLPDGPPCPGRPARIRYLGNAVVPAQGAMAIKEAL